MKMDSDFFVTDRRAGGIAHSSNCDTARFDSKCTKQNAKISALFLRAETKILNRQFESKILTTATLPPVTLPPTTATTTSTTRKYYIYTMAR